MSGKRPDVPDDFPENLKQLILKGWSQDPNERCSLTEFIAEFKEMKRR